jgi:hypothetical protein
MVSIASGRFVDTYSGTISVVGAGCSMLVAACAAAALALTVARMPATIVHLATESIRPSAAMIRFVPIGDVFGNDK